MAWPPFVYSFCNVLHPFPTQAIFWQRYLDDNAHFFEQKQFPPAILQALQARLYRAYPSLVRDWHFALLVREQATTAEVLYNPQLDYEEGIDLLLQWQECLFGIHLYTDTWRAHRGRQRKQTRHTPFDNVHAVELPVNFRGSQPCGDFFLYGQRELRQLQASLRQVIAQQRPSLTGLS